MNFMKCWVEPGNVNTVTELGACEHFVFHVETNAIFIKFID